MKKAILALSLVLGWTVAGFCDTGDIPLSSNFQENSGRPLDARIVTTDLTSRDALPAINRYDGLTVYSRSNSHTYQLQGGVLNANWVDVTGGGIVGAGGIVSPGTFTWVNNFGISVSTFVTSSSMTVGGPMIGAGGVGTTGQVLASQGPGLPPTFIDPIVSQSTGSNLHVYVDTLNYLGAPISASNPLPISGSVSATFTPPALTTVTYNGVTQPHYITGMDGIVLGTSTNNPVYTYTSNPSTAPINVTVSSSSVNVVISSGSGAGGSVLTLSGRISPTTVGTLTNASSIVSVFCSSYSNVTFMITPGTSTGITANFEASIDSGVNWIATQSNRMNTYNVDNNFVLNTTTNVWTASIIGMTNFRVRASAWSAGIATVTIQVTGDPVSQTVSVGQPTASALNATVTHGGVSQPVYVTNVPSSTFVTAQPVTSSFTVVTSTTPLNTYIVNTVTMTLMGAQPTTSTSTYVVNPVTATVSATSSLPVGGVVSSATIPSYATDGSTRSITLDGMGRMIPGNLPWGSVIKSTWNAAGAADLSNHVLVSSASAGLKNYLCSCVFMNTNSTTNGGFDIAQSSTAAGNPTLYVGVPDNYLPTGVGALDCTHTVMASVTAGQIVIAAEVAVTSIKYYCTYFTGP